MRDKIAAALSGVTVPDVTPDSGLDAHENTPYTLTEFQAWPVWVGTTWRTGCLLDIEWTVIVLLPAGSIDSWTPAADALTGPIRDALETQIGHVDRVEPVTVTAADAQTPMPGLRFYLTTPTN